MNKKKYRAWDGKHMFFDVIPGKGIDEWGIVMQSSDEKDRNGTEVYEGDILIWVEDAREEGSFVQVGEVMLNKDRFYVRGLYGYGGDLSEVLEVEDGAEVIGDIYANPKLLRV